MRSAWPGSAGRKVDVCRTRRGAPHAHARTRCMHRTCVRHPAGAGERSGGFPDVVDSSNAEGDHAGSYTHTQGVTVIISGQVHRVDEPLQAFIPRYLKSKGHPTDGFVDWGGTHVYCVILPTQHEPAPNGTGFEPYLSTSAHADDKGRVKAAG